MEDSRKAKAADSDAKRAAALEARNLRISNEKAAKVGTAVRAR